MKARSHQAARVVRAARKGSAADPSTQACSAMFLSRVTIGNQVAEPLRLRWNALAPREQTLVGVATAVVALGLVWWLLLAPALRTLAAAPAEHARLDAQLQQMQQLQARMAGQVMGIDRVADGLEAEILLPGRAVRGLAGVQLDLLAPTGLHPRDALGDVQRLAAGVRVPGGAGSGGEAHLGHDHVLTGITRVRDGVQPDVARELLGRVLGGGRAGVDQHGVAF